MDNGRFAGFVGVAVAVHAGLWALSPDRPERVKPPKRTDVAASIVFRLEPAQPTPAQPAAPPVPTTNQPLPPPVPEPVAAPDIEPLPPSVFKPSQALTIVSTRPPSRATLSQVENAVRQQVRKELAQRPKPTAKPSPPSPAPVLGVTRDAEPAPTNTKPPYPRRALRSNIQGVVLLELRIDAEGKATVRVAKPSGSTLLDRAAAQHVQTHWTFKPALRNGRPVASVRTHRVVFVLEGNRR